MPHARSEYKRLPGGRSRLFRRDRLYLGPDHVLLARSLSFSEEYRRFYYSDIQALVLQERPMGNRRLADSVAIGVAVAAIVALFATGHPVWGALLSIVAVAYAWVALRREDCQAWVQTAVGAAELPSLCRARSARKAIALIDERTRAAQPPLPPEELSRALETPPPLPFQIAASPPAPPALPIAAEASRRPSRLYLAGFGLLLALGVFKMYAALSMPRSFPWVMPAGYLIFLALTIVPLLRQGMKNIRGSRAAAVLTSIVVTGSVATYALSWATSESSRNAQDANTRKIYAMLETAAPLHVGIAVVLLLLAIWGLLAFLMAEEPVAGRSNAPLTLFGSDRL
jgi:hypothetical protein